MTIPPLEMISDFLLAAGSFGAAAYCRVLSVRLRRFNALESGMGGAIAVLSAQVDDMTRALAAAQRQAQSSSHGLEGLIARGDAAAKRLELMLAALHDLPEPAEETEAARKPRFVRRRAAAEVAE